MQRRAAAGRAVRRLGVPAPAAVELLHRELLRAGGRWAELVELDPTDEQAHLGLAQALLAPATGRRLRQLDALEQVLREELGIGLSPEAYDLRERRGTPRWPRPQRRPGTGLARQSAPLLRDRGRGAAGLRHQRRRTSAGEGIELADPPRL